MTCTESEFINLYEDPLQQLTQIRLIITALDAAVLSMAEKGAIKSYSLNDGQVTISRGYGSMKEITDSRLFYQQEFNRIAQKCEGRTTFLIPC